MCQLVAAEGSVLTRSVPLQVVDDTRHSSPPVMPRPSSTFSGSTRNQDLVPVGEYTGLYTHTHAGARTHTHAGARTHTHAVTDPGMLILTQVSPQPTTTRLWRFYGNQTSLRSCRRGSQSSPGTTHSSRSPQSPWEPFNQIFNL